MQARKPRAEWKKLDDLTAQLAEFDLRCAAGDYDTAASVLVGSVSEYLDLWGHFHLMIRTNEKVMGKITDLELKGHNLSRLGQGFYRLGNSQKAIEYLEQALELDRKNKNRAGEQTDLYGLGYAHHSLGNVSKSIEFYKQALSIANELGDRRGEAIGSHSIGNAYADIGETYKAIISYEQSLPIAREVEDKEGESVILRSIGSAYLDLGEFQKAEENIKQALQIANEILSPPTQNFALFTLTTLYLFQNDLTNAQATIEAMLQYNLPKSNHFVTALHGIIALRQGERGTAQEAFTKSIAQADEILAKTPEYYDALDAKGLSICGLTICGEDGRRKTVDGGSENLDDGQQSTVYRQQAIETFHVARKIAPHAGVVKSVLRLFDELVKCDEEGILKDVRKAAEGKE